MIVFRLVVVVVVVSHGVNVNGRLSIKMMKFVEWCDQDHSQSYNRIRALSKKLDRSIVVAIAVVGPCRGRSME